MSGRHPHNPITLNKEDRMKGNSGQNKGQTLALAAALATLGLSVGVDVQIYNIQILL